MTTRSLTDVFILMRNNAIQNRKFYSEQQSTDRTALMEQGHDYRELDGSTAPPIWANKLEEAQYALSKLDSKIKELAALHNKNAHRPTFDDVPCDQQQIESLTRDISRMFVNCHKLVETIKRQSNMGNSSEKRLAQNAMSSLASSLQNLSVNFRFTQNDYLRTLKSREERSKQYFNSALDQEFETWQVDDDIENIDKVFGLGPSTTQTQQQLLLLEEENTRMAAEREQKVRTIVKSIVDLNEIFKDLAHMITDQGTVLDRIDYNIEKTSVQVHQGFQQLQKAEAYQRKNRKMTCIIAMAATTLIMFILLVIIKF